MKIFSIMIPMQIFFGFYIHPTYPLKMLRNFTRKSKWAFLAFLVVPFFQWSCFPEPDSNQLLDQFVVSTEYDPNADFKSYITYSLRPDTIGLVSNVGTDDTIIYNDYAKRVVTTIKTNMNMRGYSFVSLSSSPDLIIKPYVVKNLDIYQQVVYPGYSYGYSSYYYNYGPYIYTSAYNTGYLVMEIIDLKNITAQNQVKVIWYSYMGDVFNALDVYIQSEDGIDQAFLQSPYLQK